MKKPMSRATLNKRPRSLLAVLAALILVGCAEQAPRYPVSGKVMIDGAPLKTGSIRFVPEKGRPVTSAIASDGSFELAEASLSANPNERGVALGKYRVAVSAMKVIDEDIDKVEWLAPSKYANHRTSEIEVEIDGPEPDLVVELTWEGNELPEKSEEDQELVEQEDETQSSADDSPEQEAISGQ